MLNVLPLTHLQAKKRPKLFWVSAIAPLTSVILSTLIVKFSKADERGVAIVSSGIIIQEYSRKTTYGVRPQ
jgi:hypothetical protein